MDARLWGASGEGNTPLDADESEGLLPPHITTRAELNGWEAENIREAIEWAAARTPDMLDREALKALHQRMFGKTWRWAGTYRTSEKSISPFTWSEVPRLVSDLLENTRAQHAHAMRSDRALDELAARFHHQLVLIHPWPNGNGRHARLATDLLLRRWGRPPFSWGSATSSGPHDVVRTRYLQALAAADNGRFDALYGFVRA